MRLMPPADQGFAALLDDLDSRERQRDTLAWIPRWPRSANIVSAKAP
jgi:hypothetical protein